jgi:3-hydroxyacyl-CoA dehydrogenase/enoyl-CoA hydratase/3-hydroxybutyryl-CoA epimerase
VTKEAEVVLGENKIYASNTSTIPISILAEASDRPNNFIGVHFFSPVDKMPLVEIIVGKATSEYAIAAAIDYVTQIGKVPIVVNDSRGFFTSRVFGTYTGEGALMLQEGVPAAMIENVAKRVGMPVGPLAVTDEVALTLALHVMDEAPSPSPEEKLVYSVYKAMARELGREGKKVGKGFYEYPAGDKKFLWPGLKELFKEDINAVDAETVGKRLLHIMALESYRCLEENVLRSPKDGDLGSMLGLGFPPYTGGVFSYIDFVGAEQFVKECDTFTAKFGSRFAVPDSLRKMAEKGEKFY